MSIMGEVIGRVVKMYLIPTLISLITRDWPPPINRKTLERVSNGVKGIVNDGFVL
jgi:hypothetical protein